MTTSDVLQWLTLALVVVVLLLVLLRR